MSPKKIWCKDIFSNDIPYIYQSVTFYLNYRPKIDIFQNIWIVRGTGTQSKRYTGQMTVYIAILICQIKEHILVKTPGSTGKWREQSPWNLEYFFLCPN